VVVASCKAAHVKEAIENDVNSKLSTHSEQYLEKKHQKIPDDTAAIFHIGKNFLINSPLPFPNYADRSVE